MSVITKNVYDDFSNELNITQLHYEINSNTQISTGLDGVVKTGNTLQICFVDNLSGAENAILNSIISNHSRIQPSVNISKGKYWIYDSSSLEFASDEWVESIECNTGFLLANDFLLKLKYYWSCDKTTNLNGRITVDDSTEIVKHMRKRTVSNISEFDVVDALEIISLTDGNHNFKVQFNGNDITSGVHIKDVYMSLKKL